MAPTLDVLISGAGPVGLVCALVLAQNGVSVRLVEKLSKLVTGQRGSGISPRTLELYNFLGLLDEIKKQGGSMQDVLAYDVNGKPQEPYPLMPRCEVTPDIPEPNYWILGQNFACAILHERLKTFGVTVEFETELVDFVQDATSVTATLKCARKQVESVQAKFLVGADGGRSLVRKLTGTQFIGETTPEFSMVTGEAEISGLDKDHWHQFRSGPSTGFAARYIHEESSLFNISAYGLDKAKAIANISYLQQHIEQTTKNPHIKITRVAELGEWRLNVRMAEKFQVRRVFLSGDAGHVHSPAGGQGMNSGLQDSINLGWKLALVCKELSPASLLESYDEERQPVIREMLNITVNIFNKNFKNKTGREKVERPLSIRQLGVHYRWSSIVVDELQEGPLTVGTTLEHGNTYGDEKFDRLHAGDRAPDASEIADVGTGAKIKLFDIFTATQHTVLLFDPTLTTEVSALVSKYQNTIVRIVVLRQSEDASPVQDDTSTFTDVEGHATRAYAVKAGVKAAVIRPDGVVGALAGTCDGISEYFSKIFF